MGLPFSSSGPGPKRKNEGLENTAPPKHSTETHGYHGGVIGTPEVFKKKIDAPHSESYCSSCGMLFSEIPLR